MKRLSRAAVVCLLATLAGLTGGCATTRKAYYNTWLRWGSPSFFGEVNYISWEENLEGRGRFYSQSVGVSLGFPLARVL